MECTTAATSSSAAAAAETTAGCWVFTDAQHDMKFETIPLPSSLPPGYILVRLSHSTICGSDIHTIEGRRVDPAAPLVLGHEGMGVVVAMGVQPSSSSSSAIKIGQRVTWGVAASCGACPPCTEFDLPQKCTRVVKYGHASFHQHQATDAAVAASENDATTTTTTTTTIRQLESLAGTYGTHILLRPGTTVVPLPVHVPDAVAAPANCALATVCAAWRAACHALPTGVRPTRVLVQGCGLLGLYACAIASSRGATTVVATDISVSRRAMAMKFGATSTVDVHVGGNGGGASSIEIEAALKQACNGGSGYDVVFEVCGVPSSVPQAINVLRPGGIVTLVGLVHPDSSLAGITAESLIRKCATVIGVHNYTGEDLVEAVKFLDATYKSGGNSSSNSSSSNSNGFPYDELTSDAQPLFDLPEAMTLARTGKFSRVLLKN